MLGLLCAFEIYMYDDFQDSGYINRWAPAGSTGMEWLNATIKDGASSEITKTIVKYDDTHDPGNYVLRTYYHPTDNADYGWFAAEYVDNSGNTPSWGDVAVDFSFRIADFGAQDWDGAVFYFRLTDPQIGMGGGGNEKCYYLLFGKSGYCELGYFDNEMHDKYTSWTIGVDITKWTRVRVEIWGYSPVHIKLFFNDDYFTSYEINDPAHWYGTGSIGFGVTGNGVDTVEVYWDNVRVAPLDAEKVIGESYDFETVAGSYFVQFSESYSPEGLVSPVSYWKSTSGDYEVDALDAAFTVSALWASSFYDGEPLDLSYSVDMRTKSHGSNSYNTAGFGFRYSGKIKSDSGFYDLWIPTDGSTLRLSQGTGTDVYSVTLPSPVDISEFHRLRVDTIGNSTRGVLNIRVWLDGVKVMDYDITSDIEDGRGVLLISSYANAVFDNLSVKLSSPKPLSQNVDGTTVTLSWLGVNGVTGYTVQVSRDIDFTDIVFQQNVTGTQVEVDLSGDGMYYWRVKSLYSDDSASSYYSETWSFEINTGSLGGSSGSSSSGGAAEIPVASGSLLPSYLLKAGRYVGINLKALPLSGSIREVRLYLSDPFGTVLVSKKYREPEDIINFLPPATLPGGVYILKLKVLTSEGEVDKFVKVFVRR